MGGSRCSKLRNYWNIFVTFLVSGIWHGANWTFIVWGCMHGICQIIEKMLGQQKCNYGWFGKTIKIVITFLFVNFAWIFFRAGAIDAEGLKTVREVLAAIGHWSIPATLLSPLAIIFLLLGFALQLLDGETPRRLWEAFNRLPPLVQGLLAAVILAIVFGLGPAGVAPFIYFQF